MFSLKLLLVVVDTAYSLGEGTNACYLEKQKNAELFDEENRGSGVVIINTEWGAFGNDGVLNFLRTEVDEEMDETSINRGHHL